MKNLKTKLFSIVFTFGLASISVAQTWSNYTLTSGGSAVVPVAMTEDSSGYVYVLGSTGNSGGNMVVMKFTSGGSLSASQEFGGANGEVAYDIAYGPDGNLYLLGTTQGNKLDVFCIDTSLSSVWETQVTATVPGGGNSTDAFPYRLSIGGTSGSPIVYATAQVQESTMGFSDLTDPVSAKAVFFCRLDSGGSGGSVAFSGAWDGRTGYPDNLYGTHAVSNGMVFITDTKKTVSSNEYSRTYYTKINGSSGAVLWSETPPYTSPDQKTHYLAQSLASGDNVYTSYGNLGPYPSGGSLNTEDSVIYVDGSLTSAPSSGNWTHSYYRHTGAKNYGIGIAYWNGQVTAVGRTNDGANLFNPVIGSYIRTLGNTLTDSGMGTTFTNTTNRYVPEANQRCVDGADGRVFGLARKFDASSFWFISAKIGASPLRNENTYSITSGYSLDKLRQVLASKASDSAYVLMDVFNGSGIHRVALYKYDR